MNKRQRRHFLRLWRQTQNYRSDPLQDRADIAYMVYQKAQEGLIGFYQWSMDCDGASGDSLTLVAAVPIEIEARINSLYDNAEGPVRWDITYPAEVEEFEATHRDHALEAFEDGHPHVLYI